MKRVFRVVPALGLTAAVVWAGAERCHGQSAASQPQVLYSTGFEFAAGYDPQYTLVGQDGWVSDGNGGNGLVTNVFEGYGQQAFIGFSPPDGTNTTINVWHPVNYTPTGTNGTLVNFSVLMAIIDSTNMFYDDFRWSVYNSSGHRLFTLDFDNATYLISYALDDGAGFVSTGTTFTNASLYAVVIAMDFKNNLWSATINDLNVVNAKAITTTNADLTFGDADAVWAIHDPANPGNNYMVFDNYAVTAETAASIPPSLAATTRLATGQFLLRLYGEPGTAYAIEASTNLVDWLPRTTLSSSNGVVDFLDTNAPAADRTFYRAHSAPSPGQVK